MHMGQRRPRWRLVNECVEDQLLKTVVEVRVLKEGAQLSRPDYNDTVIFRRATEGLYFEIFSHA